MYYAIELYANQTRLVKLLKNRNGYQNPPSTHKFSNGFFSLSPFIDKTKVQINKLISNSTFIILAKSGSVCCLLDFFTLSLIKE